MGNFQDEIQQIRQKQKANTRSDASDMERRRQECEPYIAHICDSIRRGIKLEAIEGRVVYQTFRYTRPNGRMNERLKNPHYVTFWNATCRVDITKDDFFYNPRENTFWISETDTLFYLLDEVEQRLKKDGIFVVKNIESEKRRILPFRRSEYRYEDQPTSPLDADTRRVLKQAVERCQMGIGGDKYFEIIGGRFAYFIPASGEKGSEGL